MSDVKRKIRFLWMTALLCWGVCVFADGAVRIECVSPQKLTYEHTTNAEVWESVRGKSGTPSYVTRFTAGASLDKWCELKVTLHAEKDGYVYLKLRSASSSAPVFVDHVTVSGGSSELRNGDFEEGANGIPAFWDATPPQGNVFSVTDPKKAFSGKNFVKVALGKVLAQRVGIRGGQPLRISLFFRPETVSGGKRTGYINQVTDPDSGTRVTVSTRRFETVPGYENCSYYVMRNLADTEEKQTLRVFYREKGGAVWQEAFLPVIVHPESAWRGSLFNLKENTDYEIRAELKGNPDETFTGGFRTKNSSLKVAETVVIDPAAFPGQMTITRSGRPDGYIRYVVKDNGVLKGSRGQANGVIHVKGGKYLLFENMKIQGNMSRHCFLLTDCENVVIRNCDLSDFGRSDYVRDYHLLGSWTYRGMRTDNDGGIYLRKCKDILVERCLIHHPASGSNSWFYSHPTGPSGIFTDTALGGITLRYNDVVASDKRAWDDAFQAFQNFSINGGLMRDADVYGNLMAFADDDGIEAEGGGMNVRVFFNRFEGGLSGISTSTCCLGPTYLYRNLFSRQRDEDGTFSSAFKNGPVYANTHGALFIVNNTVRGTPFVTSTRSFEHSRKRTGDPKTFSEPMAFVRNNIFLCEYSPHFNMRKTPYVQVGPNLIGYRHPKYARTNKALLEKNGLELGSLWTDRIPYADRPDRFVLKQDSPFSGKAAPVWDPRWKEFGAFQEDGIIFPYRPVTFAPDVQEVFFKDDKAPCSQTFRMKNSGDKDVFFTTFLNDDFFSVSPAAGTIPAKGETVFTVTINPAKIVRPMLARGMLLVRTPEGFSRPVPVYADYRNSEKRMAESKNHRILIPFTGKDLKKIRFKATVPEKACYFLFLKGDWKESIAKAQTTVGSTVVGKRSYLRKRTLLPDGSFYGSLNEGTQCGFYLFLEKGETEFTIEFNQPVRRVDELFLTREPEWFLR